MTMKKRFKFLNCWRHKWEVESYSSSAKILVCMKCRKRKGVVVTY